MTDCNLARALLACALAVSLWLPPSRARAQSSGSNANVAEALFRDAVALFDAGRIHEACGKFAESFRLDPANGTLQDLALCHERDGKVASAWAEYTQLVGRAARAQQKERVELARTRAAALEKRVSRLRFVFRAAPNVDAIEIDGEPLGRAAWSSPLPLDPGDHEVTFKGDHLVAISQTVRIASDAHDEALDVPRLASERDSEPPFAPRAAQSSSSTARTAAWIAGGAGVVLLGVGGYFGLRAMANKSDGDARCAGRFCDATGLALQDDAHADATLSTIFAGAGVLAIGGAAVLLLTTKPSAPTSTAVRVVPAFAPRAAGVRAEVRF